MPHGERGKQGATKSMASRKVAGKKMSRGTRRVMAQSNAAVNSYLYTENANGKKVARTTEGAHYKLAEVVGKKGGNRFEVKYADGTTGAAVIMKALSVSRGQAKANVVSAIHSGDFVIIDTTGGVGHDAAPEIKGKIRDRADLSDAKEIARWPGEAHNEFFETPESARSARSARSANSSTRKKASNANK